MAALDRGATFDETGHYRYRLWRTWDPNRPSLAWILLNPSTADGYNDDATIRRCQNFARLWGYGGIEVRNLFAYRATHRDDLKRAPDPIGPLGDWYLHHLPDRIGAIAVGWGNDGCWRDRHRVAGDRWSKELPCYCLGLTGCGQPKHPLYLPNNSNRTIWHPQNRNPDNGAQA